MNSFKRKQKGFTLIELLVAILIIGVLAAIAIPLYQKAIERSRIAEAQTVFAAAISGQAMYRTLHGTYTEDFGDLTTQLPGVGTGSTYCLKGSSNQSGCSDGIYEVKISGTEQGESLITATRVGNNKYGPYMLYRYYNSQKVCCAAATDEGRQLCSGFDSCNTEPPPPPDPCTPTQEQPESIACSELGDYASGTSTRNCQATCGGGECGEWDFSSCVTEIECDNSAKPSNTRPCPNACGTQTTTFTCDKKTGTWVPGAWQGFCSTQSSSYTDTCGMPYIMTAYCGTVNVERWCNTSTGRWVEDVDTSGCYGECYGNDSYGLVKSQNCTQPNGQSGRQIMHCNACYWSGVWGPCTATGD